MKRTFASLLTAAALAFVCLGSDALGQTAAAGLPKGEPVAAAVPAPASVSLPLKEGSVRFMVVGDTGTGSTQQYELGAVMLRYWQAFPFEFALMMGDNLYGSEKAEDYKKKFEDVYRPLLDRKVKFYATLGNHD